MSLYSRFDVIVSPAENSNILILIKVVETCSEMCVFASQQNLAAQKTYNNLDMTMQEAVRRRTCFTEGVIKCYPDETLETVINRIVEAEVKVFLQGIQALLILQDFIQLMVFFIPGPSAGPGGQG